MVKKTAALDAPETDVEETEELEFYKSEHGTIFHKELRRTPTGRVHFLNLKKASKKYGKFGFTIIWKKEDIKANEADKALLQRMVADGDELLTFGKIPKKVRDAITHAAIRDGDKVTYKPDGTEVPGPHPGCLYIQTSSKNPVEIVDRKKTPIEPQDILGGMECRAVVVSKYFDNGTTRGISWEAKLLQFVKDDGTRFATGGPAAISYVDAMDDLDDEEDGEETGLETSSGKNALSGVL